MSEKLHNLSSKGFSLVKYRDENGKIRVKVQSSHAILTPEKKLKFLEEYRTHGLQNLAATAAGVSFQTIRKEFERDPDFAELVAEASEHYKEKVLAHHQELLFNGQTKRLFDRNGNLISEEQNYPIRLIELELKKVDDGYRDKREVSMRVSGGVLVAPADVTSIDDWEKKYSNDGGEIIEGEVVDEQKIVPQISEK